ncbi:aminotransferase family protein [Marinomonas colpomeniae]|uniref:Aminotransferase class III-fold pyridoxal phosphate-dependent enzyme n=1 Tax=Marinomonas colpomeniae TaxID=2774408 RepID=A0ABR8P027_9GAMM|nr:aminotransferase class III-fold pyridoxal phosphate-dependent enzyme [Marinomonas colpomeniae]MBD5771656.1 aminotransferase class III-fold pyridoxal phosphate-dependent enzyme [Marinomonas colpomeniae]
MSQYSEYTNDQIKAFDKSSVWHHLTPGAAAENGLPMFVKGKGLDLWDIDGNQYLDASAGGVWVTNTGYGRKEIVDAMSEQLLELNFFASAMANKPAAVFANRLLEKMPGMQRVFYSSSGSEANEKAFKMVRQISHKKYGGKKNKILYRERDYHGTTLAALSATGQSQRRDQFGPFVPGFVEFPHCFEYRSQFEDTTDYGLKAAQLMEEVILREGPETVGAVIIEPITAGGGIITPPDGYLKAVEQICKKHHILLILDEVVCGLGRTGKWFGYQHYDIQPDIVTMAKGVASGYAAISCTVTTEAVYKMLQEDASDDKLGYFRDISTYGGCLAGPAAAIANMKIIEDENLIENCAALGDVFLAGLQKLKAKYPIIGDVRGKGLLLGVELVRDHHTKEPEDESVAIKIFIACKQAGLLIGRTNRSFEHNNILNMSPALCVSEAQIEKILSILDQAFASVTASK